MGIRAGGRGAVGGIGYLTVRLGRHSMFGKPSRMGVGASRSS